jgi:hypothetical protein
LPACQEMLSTAFAGKFFRAVGAGILHWLRYWKTFSGVFRVRV